MTKDAVFTITIVTAGTVVTPTSNITAGAVEKGTAVTLTTGTAGATIYYTTNGNAPTTLSSEYTGPITINKAVTLKAIAVKAGHTDSCVVTFAYTVSTHNVTYSANGGTGTPPTGTALANTDTMTVAAGTSLTKTGYTFAGWNTVATGVGGTSYAAGSTFTMGTADVTLYAQWTANSFIIPYVSPVSSNVTAIVNISYTDTNNGTGEQNANLTLVKVSDEKEKALIATAAGDTTIRKLIGSSFDLSAATTNKTLTDIMELKFDLSKENLQGVDTSKLSALRYELDSNGKLQVVRLGGQYDPKTGLFTCKTDKTGLIGIGQVDSLKQIELTAYMKEIIVNGKTSTLDVAPVIINQRTLVPVRFVTESMGAVVEWDEKTGTVTITLDGKVLKLREDPTNPTAPTMIRNSRMLVPVRYISEQFGANVMWSQSSQTVYIIAK